ncbi:glycosyltransferase family 2 protein [Hymenobacter bucti]|uniref:Glycosyltransferase family 2 protein n=1 Tax=Hymenobacter bucti TaxID=1844114 RepID=A0ABW4QPD7_9BACT
MPKVSVVVLTRNHEAYLAQALDSVLMQEVDFAYELIVGEDGSTDRTRSILEDYAQRYPAIIRPIYHSPQVGVGANLRACFAACRGQYLATLEGDDYWTAPHKLQTQVTWLDAHPDYVFCFHRHSVVQAGQPKPAVAPPGGPPVVEPKTVFEFADFLTQLVAHISTVVFRQVLPALPEWLFTVYPIDIPLLALYAEHGKVKLLPGCHSVYRVHAGGSWSAISRERRAQHYVTMHQKLRLHYAGTAYQNLLAIAHARICLIIADEGIQAGNLADARRFIGHFWANDTTYAIKRQLWKSVAGVSARLAKSTVTQLLRAAPRQA